jgi:1,4-dihydroxy-2-naphthoate octaprenyltransferase
VSLAIWFEATKPKVFIASVAPVVIGTALAIANGTVHWPSVPLLIICAMLIQLTSNWVNDIYDFRRGADAPDRVGPRRVLAEGLISQRQLVIATWIVAIVCFLLGLPLVERAGPIVLVIGVSCLAAAWAYTGGPWSLAYHGLGDVAAFLFFGVIAVCGTAYVHELQWSREALILSIGPGCLAANILGVNNMRDIPTDARVGKRTIAVRIGLKNARLLYVTLTMIALLVPSALLRGEYGSWIWLPLGAYVLASVQIRTVLRKTGQELNTALAGTAKVYVLYAALMSTALILAAR